MALIYIVEDDEINKLSLYLIKKLINHIILLHHYVSLVIVLLMVAKYFERIGDHATNIAEWVEFGNFGAVIFMATMLILGELLSIIVDSSLAKNKDLFDKRKQDLA